MLKRKWLALLLVLIMGIGSLTGCSPTEQGYYNMVKEASSQKVYTASGSIDLSLIQLPASMFTGEDALNEEIVRKAFDQNRLEYSGKVDVNQNIFQYDFDIVNKETGVRKQICSMVYTNNILYVKLDEMINYIGQFCDLDEKQRLDQAFKDVEWISISDQEFKNIIPASSQNSVTNNLLQRSAQQQKIIFKLYDGLFNDFYKNYSSNLVSKNNNKYTLTLRGAQLIDVMKPAATYTINNIQDLGMVLKAFVNSLTPAEMAELGLTDQMKAEALKGIDFMVISVYLNRGEFLSEIENINAASQEKWLNTVNDSELVSAIEKIDAATYETSCRIHLNITAGSPTNKVNINLTTKNTLKIGGTVQVPEPTTNVVTLTELDKRLPHQFKVNVDNGSYTQINGISSSSGTMTVKMVDDRTYLPLAQIAAAMGEKVGWDSVANQAYAIQNGQRISMNGILVNDRSYVQVKEFEKLGLKINWDESTRTVTLEK